VWPRYRNIDRLSIAYGYDALGLGPTNPTRILRASEPSGLRRACFSHALSLLIPAFSLPLAPGALPGLPSQPGNAPLPLVCQDTPIRSVGGGLEPRFIVGAWALDQ
jgi:hypothetical protein